MSEEINRGLYLVEPHGALVASGAKSSVAKSRQFNIVGDWILVSGKRAYGVMALGEPEEVGVKEFDARWDEHRVDVEDRLRWWPGAKALWMYPVEEFTGYGQPLRVEVPAGVQTVMGEVEFEGETIKASKDTASDDTVSDDTSGQSIAEPSLKLSKNKGGESIATTEDTFLLGLKAHEGVMMALRLPAKVTQTLALSDGDAAEPTEPKEMHVTLCYLGEAARFEGGDEQVLKRVLRGFAQGEAGIAGRLNGVGRFVESGEPGKHVVYANFDSSGLSGLRQRLVEFLQDAGFSKPSDHGFTPHVTLAYVSEDEETPKVNLPEGEIECKSLWLFWKGEATELPLGVKSGEKLSNVKEGEVEERLAGEGDKALGDYPDESKHLKFVAQNHYVGKSCHLNLRFEFICGDDHFLRGWTVAHQVKGAIKSPITTMEEARKADAVTGNWKIDLESGIIKSKAAGDGRRGNLRAFPKKGEIPSKWLTVEGVVAESTAESPTGAHNLLLLSLTPNAQDVFTIVQKGEVEWGAQLPWFHEFFLKGSKWKGRWCFRLVKREGEKWFTPECEEDLEEFKAKVEESSYWILMQPSGVPYVLSSEATSAGWLSPRGVSCLPREMRERVPQELRYWDMARSDALKARAALAEVESGDGMGEKVVVLGEIDDDADTKMGRWRTLPDGKRVQVIAKVGDEKDEETTDMKQITVLLDDEQLAATDTDDTATDDKAKWTAAYIGQLPDTAFLLIEKGGEKKDGITRPLSLRHLPVRSKDGEIDLPHLRNAIARAPQMKDKEGKPFSSATIARIQKKARELLAEQKKARGEGQGAGGPRQGLGPTDVCVCPECGKEYPHEPNVPCAEMKCEKCDVPLVGKDSATSDETEQTTAGDQMRRGIVAAASNALSRLIKKKTQEIVEVSEAEADETDTDEKTGKRLQGAKLESLQKLHRELEDFLKAFKDFLGWAGYDEPTTPLEAWLAGESGQKAMSTLNEHGSTAYAFKTIDGHTWWMQWTSNAFRDREGEIFSTKSLADYVARHRDERVKGEFWYRHVPGTKFGDVLWQAMSGRFLVQAGPFDDTPIGVTFKEFFSAHPNGHPVIAPEGWGASHKYRYKADDRTTGVYETMEIVESTVLPLSVASNLYNPRPTIIDTQEVKQVNKQEQKDLEAIGGLSLVELVTKAGEGSTKELEEAGVAYKANGGEPNTEAKAETDKKASFADQVEAVVAKVSDDALKKRVTTFHAKIEGGDAKALGKELQMLAGQVGGAAGKELKAIADEMTGAEKGKKETETEPEPDTEPDADTLSREEVADALKAIVGVLREEIEASSNKTITAIAESLEPLVEEVKALKRDDTKKIAEKAADTPAASLSALLQSVIGQSATKVDPNSTLAKSGPQETQPFSPAVTGVPFVDQFIDQRTVKRDQ